MGGGQCVTVVPPVSNLKKMVIIKNDWPKKLICDTYTQMDLCHLYIDIFLKRRTTKFRFTNSECKESFCNLSDRVPLT